MIHAFEVRGSSAFSVTTMLVMQSEGKEVFSLFFKSSCASGPCSAVIYNLIASSLFFCFKVLFYFIPTFFFFFFYFFFF